MTAPASGWFRGLAAQEPTPGRTAFVRFRAGLVRRGLDRPLYRGRHAPAGCAHVTTAHVHDAAGLDVILPDASGDAHGGSACLGCKPPTSHHPQWPRLQ